MEGKYYTDYINNVKTIFFKDGIYNVKEKKFKTWYESGEDNPLFRDSHGYSCTDWKDFDLEKDGEKWYYSQQDISEIKKNCGKTQNINKI